MGVERAETHSIAGAIAVYAGPCCISFIPRTINTISADMMSQGRQLAAASRTVDPDATPWQMVKIEEVADVRG